MKIIVCGTRTFNYYLLLKRTLDKLTAKLKRITIITGAAKGADALAERWARENWRVVIRFHADWQKHGKKAGPIRNQEMIEYMNGKGACIGFWDGKSAGTKDILERAKKNDLRVKIITYKN